MTRNDHICRHIRFQQPHTNLRSASTLFSSWTQKVSIHMVIVSADTFLLEGRRIMRHVSQISSAVEYRRFRGNFGTTPENCVILWDMITPNESMPKGVKCCHLLWALMFLKLYASEHVLCSRAECDEKTFRKWVWLFVLALADLEPKFVSTACKRIQNRNSLFLNFLTPCSWLYALFMICAEDFVGE